MSDDIKPCAVCQMEDTCRCRPGRWKIDSGDVKVTPYTKVGDEWVVMDWPLYLLACNTETLERIWMQI